MPCHREALKRSHVDKTIVLMKIENRYVPIVETAIKVVEKEEASSEDNKEVTGNDSETTLAAVSDDKAKALLDEHKNLGLITDPLNATRLPSLSRSAVITDDKEGDSSTSSKEDARKNSSTSA